MQVKILEYNEDKEISMELQGEGHTFANLIREFLSDVKDVDSAGYMKEHPFVEKSKLVVKAVPKKKLDKAVRIACRDLSKAADDFYKLLEKTA